MEQIPNLITQNWLFPNRGTQMLVLLYATAHFNQAMILSEEKQDPRYQLIYPAVRWGVIVTFWTGLVSAFLGPRYGFYLCALVSGVNVLAGLYGYFYCRKL